MDAFEIVGKAFSLAGLQLREVKLLSIEEPFVKRFLTWFFQPGLDSKDWVARVNSIYAVTLVGRSPWFALVLRSRRRWHQAVLARKEKPRDVIKDLSEMLIDDVEQTIMKLKEIEQAEIDLELEDMSLPGETWPKGMTVLREGRGFYETLVENCLEGDGIGNRENANEDKID